MKKILIGCATIYIVMITVLVFVWSSKPNMTNEKYESTEVHLMPGKDVASYTDLLNHIVKDDDITDVSALENNAELIINGSLKDRRFVGNGVINVCDIKTVYKGDYKEHTILIYDYVPFWGENVNYFEGAVPLQYGEDYVMFLNYAPNPNQKDTYIFTSINYGHFRLKEDVTYDIAYDLEKPMNIKEISKYDYVCYDGRNLDTFKKLQKQIFIKYRS